jgi:ribosomal protein L32E
MLIRKLILFCGMLALASAPLAEAKTKGYQKPSFKRSKHAKKNFKHYKGKWRKTRG